MLDTLSVTQYSTYIKQIFDAEELLHNIKIVGEVFGLSKSRGVAYFSLKDENCMISCVCFNILQANELNDGEKVVVCGSPNYYLKGGRLSFNVQSFEKAGKGDLQAQFLAMKAKLEKQGLFDQSRKKPMPKKIETIAVITSKDGAVIHDIQNVAQRRDESINIALFPVKVQGKGAENEIASAIKKLSSFDQVDVIVVARGGGSEEDLAAYNTEVVALAAAECEKFLVSAVGHETDFTIIDFVADLRAPTPSAAAELLTKNKSEQKNAFSRLAKAFESEFKRFYEKKSFALEKYSHMLANLTDSFLANKNFELGMLDNSLAKISPLAVLKRGYALVEQDGKVVDKAQKIMLKSNISIKFFDGKVIAEPKEVDDDV